MSEQSKKSPFFWSQKKFTNAIGVSSNTTYVGFLPGLTCMGWSDGNLLIVVSRALLSLFPPKRPARAHVHGIFSSVAQSIKRIKIYTGFGIYILFQGARRRNRPE